MVVPGGLKFYCWCFFLFFSFFFFSPQDLRAPLADRCENLPRDRKCVQFYNPDPKIWGALPKKNLRPKMCKIWGNFRQLQTLIANITRIDRHIQNRKTNDCDCSSCILQKSPVNFGQLTTQLDMWVWTHPNQLFRKTIFWLLWSTNKKVIDAHADPPKSNTACAV